MKESLKKLIEGNKRFAEGKSSHLNLGEELRNSLLTEQNPFAVIVSCSDSRVPVEIIFDAGIGDLFIIRSAGHVISREAMGCIEYAIEHLGVKLVVVLGHDNCGAIKSALATYKKGDNHLTENLKTLLGHIYPVFEKIDINKEDILEEAIDANIKYQVQDLIKEDPFLAEKIKEQNVLLLGAKYSLKTGLVDFYLMEKEVK